MATDIMQPMRFTVDLSTGLVEKPQRAHLRYGDKNANRIIVEVTDGGKAVSLSGVSASGIFYRPPDGDEVPMTGSVSGSEVSVTLNDHCYTQEGFYSADVVLVSGSVTRTILTVTGYVRREGNGVLVDVNEALVNIDEILAKLQDLSAITDRAEAAATRVEQMQIDASGLAGDSNKLGGKPPEYYLPAVNLLDNSWFGGKYSDGVKYGIIHQAGLNGLHGNDKYPMDRWISYDADVIFADGYITPGSPIDQRHELEKFDLSKTYTVAIGLSNGTIKCAYGTLQKGAGAFALGIHAIADASYVRVRLMTGFDIVWAVMYEGAYTGDTLPPYVPKPYSVELAACKRFYENSWHGVGKNALYQMPGAAWSLKNFDVQIQFLQEKRRTPTMAYYPSGDRTTIQMFKSGVYRDVSIDGSVDRLGKKGIYARVLVSEGDLDIDETYQLHAHWEASADL